MSDKKPIKVNMDELRKGVQKVLIYKKPVILPAQQKSPEEDARHRSPAKRRTVKTPAR